MADSHAQISEDYRRKADELAGEPSRAGAGARGEGSAYTTLFLPQKCHLRPSHPPEPHGEREPLRLANNHTYADLTERGVQVSMLAPGGGRTGKGGKANARRW
jgi:hypothetical protein